jgi:hypothetical protein
VSDSDGVRAREERETKRWTAVETKRLFLPAIAIPNKVSKPRKGRVDLEGNCRKCQRAPESDESEARETAADSSKLEEAQLLMATLTRLNIPMNE